MKGKIIYIMGLGRSGSTLLDVILGNATGAFSCGELNRYVFEEGVPYQFPFDHPSSIFWGSVREKMCEKLTPEDFERLRRLSRNFDYHSGFIANYIGLGNKSKGLREIVAFNSRLYETIFVETGAQILIDSSKYSNRAITLSKISDFEVCYIYLKKDPVQVVRSFGKKDVEQGSRNWLSANLYYFFASMLCWLTYHRLKGRGLRICTLRYEKLMKDPVQELKWVSEQLDVDLGHLVQLLETNQPFEVGTLFYGNRVRLEKSVRLLTTDKSNWRMRDLATRLINYIWFR